MSNTIAAGIWAIDPSHSEISFSVRHLMVSKVRGHFTKFPGPRTTAEDSTKPSVSAGLEAASIDTRDENRDNHLRPNEFFDIETYPT